MSNPQKSQFSIFANLGVVYIIWGSTFLGVKYTIEVLPPLLTSSMRFLGAGSILLAFSLLKGQLIPKWPQIKAAATIGFFLTGIGTTVVAYAIKYMPTG